MKAHILILLFVALPCLATGCHTPSSSIDGDPMLSVNTLIDAPDDYAARRVGTDAYPIPPYAKFLKGVRICLNPGHGGDADRRGFKRGPTGVREAEMNLRVAQYLRDFLVACDADVKMTREDDVLLTYEERAAIANDWGADLFVSLHHNAIDNKPEVNYTTVWYHGEVSYRPSNLDLARYLCDGLYDALALPRITDVPLKSDHLMYKDGFAVLRHAKVTAALCESSFFTNPDEEQRLRRPEYNLREAYGLFIGLARYAAAGLPRARLIASPNELRAADGGADKRSAMPIEAMTMTPTVSNESGIVFELDDGLRRRKAWGHERNMILPDTIAVRIDGRRVQHEFHDDGSRYLLRVEAPVERPPGSYQVEVQFQNMNKNSVLNPYFTVEYGG